MQATETRKKKLGGGRPDTLTSIGGLAFTHCNKGLRDEAEKMQCK